MNIRITTFGRFAGSPRTAALALTFAFALTGLCSAQSSDEGKTQESAQPPGSAQPAAKPANAQAKPQKLKKKEEPEEEWVLLPEPVKPAAAATGASAAPMPQGTAAAAVAVAAPTAADASSAQPASAQPASAQAGSAQAATPAGSEPPAAGGEQRLALVIGNSSYKTGRLPNAGNDAHAMSEMLRRLGWQVVELENVGRDEMRKAAEDFSNRLAAGNGVGLFYYAGHGIQSGNVNYLIPVDADIQDEDELPAHAYDSSDLLHRMDRAKNKLSIVILDACRNNPFANRFASVSKGLASIQPGSETPMIISYATIPGGTAADGTGANGLYTTELLRAMSQTGLGVEEVFKEVRAEVKKKSGNKQIPYEANSLTSDFYFNPTAEQAAQQPMLASNASLGTDAGQARSLQLVLISREVFKNYQLSAELPLPAAKTLAGFNADGSRFFAVTADRRLRVWDVANGSVTLTQPDFGSASLSNNRFLLGQGNAHTVYVLDTEAHGAALKSYQIAGELQSFGLSPDGRRLLVYTKERGFQLLDTASVAFIGEPRKIDGDPRFAFAPAGNRVLLWGTQSGDMYFFDTDSGAKVGHGSHKKALELVRFSDDGSLLLTAVAGDSTRLWKPNLGKEMFKLDIEQGDPLPIQAEFINGGKSLLLNMPRAPRKTGDAGYLLGVWNTATGQRAGEFAVNVMAKDLRLSPDGTRMFVTGTDRSTRVFDVASRTQVDALSGAELIGFSPDGSRLIAQDGDGVRLYDARSFTPITRLPGQITAFISPAAGNFYATAASDGSVRLVDFQKGDIVSALKGHIDPVTSVSFAPKGRQVVTFSDDKIAKIWSLPTVTGVDKLAKDSFESSTEYQKRVADWSSDYTALVQLGDYNADTESYAAKIGASTVNVPMRRDEARALSGQQQAMLTGKLKMYDADNLQLSDVKLARVP
jgi:WD40 repeat protein